MGALSPPGKGSCAHVLVEMQNAGDSKTLMPMIRADALVLLTCAKGTVAREPEKVQTEDVADLRQMSAAI
jgi:hypothetical protein